MHLKREQISNCVIVLCLFVNAVVFLRRLLPSSEESYTYIGDDYPEHLPFPPSSTPSPSLAIGDSSTFLPISGPNASAEWESIYPPGYGFVRMGSRRRLLCAAAFHQLHCIEKMRIFLDDPSAKGVGMGHQQHCMNYLRQGFLCRADRTLEPLDLSGVDLKEMQLDSVVPIPEGEGAEGLEMRSGPGTVRTCGDMEGMSKFAAQNYREWKAAWPIKSPWDVNGTDSGVVGGGHHHGHGL